MAGGFGCLRSCVAGFVRPGGSRGKRTKGDQRRCALRLSWNALCRRLHNNVLLWGRSRAPSVRSAALHRPAQWRCPANDGRTGRRRLHFGRQSKTNERLEILTHAALARSLKACANDHLLLLPTQYGEGFTAKGFGNWFSKAARSAGLSECTAHGCARRRRGGSRKRGLPGIPDRRRPWAALNVGIDRQFPARGPALKERAILRAEKEQEGPQR